MEIVRSLLCLTWILTSSFTLCHSSRTNRSDKPADMVSMLERAISGNAAVYDPSLYLHKGAVLNLPEGKPLLNMTRSTWSLPTVSTGTNTEHVQDSVPLPGITFNRAYLGNTSLSEANQFNTNQTVEIKKSKPLAEGMSMASKGIEQKSNTTKLGLYIPFEKLSRSRRQASSARTGKTNNNARVLLLMNPSTEYNISNAQEKFLGKVLMLVKQPNTSIEELHNSSLQQQVISIESKNNLQKLLHPRKINATRMDHTLREVTQSQPAIQRINNLSKIELPLIPLEFTTENTSMNSSQNLNKLTVIPQVRNSLSSQNFAFRNSIGQTPSPLDVTQLDNNLQLNNWRNRTQLSTEHLVGRQPNRQSISNRRTADLHNSNRQTTKIITNRQTGRQRNNNQQNINNERSGRGSSVARSSKQLIRNQPRHVTSQQGAGNQARLSVERQLTLQHPVSSNRINRPSRSRPSLAGRRFNRPLVRTISSHNINQQTRGRRIVAPRITQTPRRARIQRRRPSTHRQVIRRRPAPRDPFTRRFSAGFQRGSNLLHQPPLDLTSFGGTPGFNTLTPVETRLPPFNPPVGLFGGIGLPGMFSRPTII